MRADQDNKPSYIINEKANRSIRTPKFDPFLFHGLIFCSIAASDPALLVTQHYRISLAPANNDHFGIWRQRYLLLRLDAFVSQLLI